ncbi:MAG: hypothetical protein AAB215_07360 [Planctomycetota bacterium]|mgnify:FL=1
MTRTGRGRRRWIIALACLLALFILFNLVVLYFPSFETRTEYGKPPRDESVALVDDRLEDKNPAFDPALADPRPLGEWSLNASAAVLNLDCPILKPDIDAWMLTLSGSHAAAMKAMPTGVSSRHEGFLPSVNLLDASTKPADDGLFTAIDLAAYQGELGVSRALPDVVADVFAGLPPDSPARPFLAVALEIAGRPAALRTAEEETKRRLLREFESDVELSKPIAFYDWTPELRRLWRFHRFLQEEFDAKRLAIPRDLAKVLEKDAKLRNEYRQILAFFSRFTNPGVCLSVDDLAGAGPSFLAIKESKKVSHPTVAFLPPLTSRETELFERLFPMGPPPTANLMNELIRRIRTGEVDLDPGKAGGWYQHQVFALETLLLPEKGREKDKLLLTAAYKRRLLEAFKALMTKKRELHARGLARGRAPAAMIAPPPPASVRPRLRLEPAATFYLRTARAYAFLETFLRAAAGEERLKALHGLSESGVRKAALAAEIADLRLRFYGFHLLSCEDIGMRPAISDEEAVDADAAKRAAEEYLARLKDDPDLIRDVRFAIPIYVDGNRNVTRLWAVLGVRMAHLEASYAKPPSIRPLKSEGDWTPAGARLLGDSLYWIPVEEFAEFELPGKVSLTRAEFRAICERCKTKEEILAALKAR